MKKIVLLMLSMFVASLMFAGCAVSETYDKAKPVYKVGKEIVKVSPISEKTRERLKKIDGELTDYDTVRNVAKPIIEKRVILK